MNELIITIPFEVVYGFFFIIMLWEFKLQYMQVSCPWEAYVELKVEHKSVEMVGLWFCSFAMIYDERN